MSQVTIKPGNGMEIAMTDVPKPTERSTIEGMRDFARVAPRYPGVLEIDWGHIGRVCDLALEALDARQAAGEAVTEEMVGAACAAYELPDDLYAALVRVVGSRRAADAALKVLAPALLLAGERRGLERAAEAAGFAAWKHEGDDDFSRGMDKGAREQVQACVAAIRALKGEPA